MTAEQQKAKELIDKFRRFAHSTNHDNGEFYTDSKLWDESSKQCALICVDEILKSNPLNPSKTDEWYSVKFIEAKEYWQSVRNEIINFK